jgi:hypothetical protein
VLAASRCKTSSLAVFVDWVHNPVNAGVVSDRDVLRIDQDYFVIFICSILVDPVRVEDSKVAAISACTFLCNTAQVSNEFKLVDTLVLWLSVNNALVVRPLAATTTNGATVDNIALH